MHDKQEEPLDFGQMVDWVSGGETPPDQHKIGTEHEKFLFHKHTLAPVAYEGEAGVGALLERLLTELGPEAESLLQTLVADAGLGHANAAHGDSRSPSTPA